MREQPRRLWKAVEATAAAAALRPCCCAAAAAAQLAAATRQGSNEAGLWSSSVGGCALRAALSIHFREQRQGRVVAAVKERPNRARASVNRRVLSLTNVVELGRRRELSSGYVAAGHVETGRPSAVRPSHRSGSPRLAVHAPAEAGRRGGTPMLATAASSTVARSASRAGAAEAGRLRPSSSSPCCTLSQPV